MTKSPTHLALTALLLAGSTTACDAEAPGAAPIDYRAVGHVDLDAVKGAPWMKDALKDGKLEVDGQLGPCADVIQQTQALSFGANEDAFEVYLEGSFDAAQANACIDHLDAHVATRPPRGDHPKPEATLMAEGVLVVFGGDLTPSRDRLDGLLAADPSGGQALWIAANMKGKEQPIESVVAWADPSKGLSAHAELRFVDEAKAAETYGKATLGLTALSLSDEVGDLASAVSLGSSGKSLSADLSLSPKQMKTLVAKGKERHQAHARFHAGHPPHGESGVEIRFESE
ncbi:MAG: hypothetical protein H6712_27140 [Myxococcales bacterium]|nr:hypothetical protein [Myxococcales bacterium]